MERRFTSKEISSGLIKILDHVKDDDENMISLKELKLPIELLKELEDRGEIALHTEMNGNGYCVPLGVICNPEKGVTHRTGCIHYHNESGRCRFYNKCFFQNID